jgi:tRNA dimethylallyltransferase
MDTSQKTPLIVIVGPTGSGKSALAMDIAAFVEVEAEAYKYEEASRNRELLKKQSKSVVQSYSRDVSNEPLEKITAPKINLTGVKSAELICADSRTVYKGMDIGTAKPTKEEQRSVRHHLLDVVEPSDTFTAAEYKARALTAISSITSKKNLPVMVGGTGLYIDGVIFDFAFLPSVGQESREFLNSLNIEQLQQKFEEEGISLPENSQNKRHLVRKLETNGLVPIKKGLRENTLVIGVDIDRTDLEERIRLRLAQMLAQGLEQEVRSLVRKYGWDAPGLSAVGYREWRRYFNEEQSLAETIQLIQTKTLQYAKRQRTWFKRNPHIQWVKSNSEAKELVKEFLRKPAS